MTRTARPDGARKTAWRGAVAGAPQTGLLRGRLSRGAAWVVLGAILGVCGMGVAIQARQVARMEAAMATIRDLRSARLDLANGFLHLALAGEPGSPFTRGEGMSLLRQATDRLRWDEAADPARAGTLREAVGELRGRLESWPADGLRDPALAGGLRDAYHAVEVEANELDLRLQEGLRAVARGDRRELVAAAVAGAALVAVFCAVLLVLRRRELAAEREAWQAERTLRERERELTLIADNLPGLVSHFDLGLRYRFANEGYRVWFGADPAELVGRHVTELIGEEDFASEREYFERARAGEIVTYEHTFATRGREPRHALATLVPDRDESGRVAGLIALAIDITGRRVAEQALRELNADLERRVETRTLELAAKNRELEMFTYSVSHDLKAPLRGIDGYSRLLLEEHAERLDEEGRRFLGHVRQAAAHMGQLIDDLLAYSRLERRSLQPARVRPKALVRSLLDACAPEIGKRGVVVEETVPEELELRADPQALTMALRNLIDNALKFTRARPDARIEIGARAESGECVIRVADNGIGFDMKFAGRIFDIFQRLHRIEDYPGTGIGLAIVRKAMERAGGSVSVESAPGQGATFFLKLPLLEP